MKEENIHLPSLCSSLQMAITQHFCPELLEPLVKIPSTYDYKSARQIVKSIFNNLDIICSRDNISFDIEIN